MAKTNTQRKEPVKRERLVQPVLPGQKWMTSQQVRQRYGNKSLQWLYDKKLDPKFPKPRYDGNHKLYLVAEFDEYDKKLEASLSPPAKAEA